VYTADLSETEVEYLRREARTIIDDVERLTGASVERRREGLMLVDTSGVMSDRRFPTGGAPAHAALLLGERLLRDAAIAVAFPAMTGTHGALRQQLDRARDATHESQAIAPEAVVGVQNTMDVFLMNWNDVDTACAELTSEYAEVLRKDVAGEPQRFRDLALGELATFDLVRVVAGGVVVMPALARYRPEVRVDIGGGAQLSLLSAGQGENT
jgi:uncharacterized protein (TIGR02678 family)